MVGAICRLWWPKPLLGRSDLLLFGWFFGSSSDSLDLVVASGICPYKISLQCDLQEVLRLANREMPPSMLGCSETSIVGYLHIDFASDEPSGLKFSTCGCLELDKMIELQRQHSVSGKWIQLSSLVDPLSPKGGLGIPKSSHVHENGTVVSIHHLHASHGAAGRMHFFKLPPKKNNVIFTTVFWHFVSACAASVSTLIYIPLHLCHNFLNSRSKLLIWFSTSVSTVFPHVWLNVNIHCNQFLYWPMTLQGSSSRLHSNVEYMHKIEVRKHAWCNAAFDGILGFMLGLLLLMNAQIVYHRIVFLSGQVTNSLRSGCVWLMGVPAGFKLNTELAEMLGIVSLNAIQIWSTIWFFIGSALPYAVIALAFSGIFLGLTVLLAMCIDVLKFVTMHITILHWSVSFIYTQQILALSSLWRLFRGRKWNPLRKRLDSFDYTVEEHVVGSLLFTPVLLLLPTTSVFYIFFTILGSSISLTCILIEIIISLLHAIPYAEVLMWMLREGRFPSGIWFEILATYSNNVSAPALANHYRPSNLSTLDMNQRHSWEPSILVSVLHSNHANIGQILMPKFSKVFVDVPIPSGFSCFYGILSGQRIPSTLQTGMPSAMPRINLSFLDYWWLCHESVLEYGLRNNR